MKRKHTSMGWVRQQRGQSIVEMALVLPFLLLVVLGIIELGYYVYTYSELENATRRASERAAKAPPVNPAKPNDSTDNCVVWIKSDALQGRVLSQLTTANIQLSFVNPTRRQIGDQIRVSVVYDGSFLTPIAQQFFGNRLQFEFVSQRTIVAMDPKDCK